MWQEFKEFAFKGNAIALAVGVVLGAAFNAIVASIVTNLFNPLIGWVLGGVDLANKILVIVNGDPAGPYKTAADATAAGALFIGYGAMVATLINFLVVAIALFFIVKAVSKVYSEPEPDTMPCPYCTTDISKQATRCPACTSQIAEGGAATA